MDKDIFKMIEMLINTELGKANKEFPQFQSRHEAYGVMLEEFEEAETEFQDIKTGLLKDYWDKCKNSKTATSKDTLFLLDCLEAAIKCNIKELLQLGAMVIKSKTLENKPENCFMFIAGCYGMCVTDCDNTGCKLNKKSLK